MIDRAALPSAAYKNLIAQQVLAGLSHISPDIMGPTMDVLGDVFLSLACRPVSEWYGSRDQLARLAGDAWAWPEATAAVELAQQGGLLVPWRGALRPRDLAVAIWLAARRTTMSEDARGLMDHRLRGSLFDVFALAPAFTDEEEAVGLVELYATHEGPWEDLLQLGKGLAATAIAWGAPAGAERRAELVRAAFDWTGIDGPAHLHNLGVALLCAEVREGPYAADVRDGVAERIHAALEQLADPDLTGHPGLNATLQADLAVAAALSGGDLAALGDLPASLGAAHASKLGRGVAMAFVPGKQKNALLIAAAHAAIEQGDPEALATLDALVEPFAGAIGPIHNAFKAVLEAGATDDDAVALARGACRAVAHWNSTPELTSHLLARLVVAPVDADLRLDAAAALSKHPARFAASRDKVLDTLEAGFGDDDVLRRTACVGAAMHLGTEHTHAPAIAIGLVADGVPAEVLGPAIAEGLRQSPVIANGVVTAWERWGSEAPIQQATVDLLEQVGELARAEHTAGAFFLRPPQHEQVRAAFLKILLAVAGDVTHPELAGTAALAAGWIARGDVGLAKTFAGLRNQVSDEQHKALLDMAMGATGVAHEVVVGMLGRDVAEAEPALSAAAALALVALLDERGDAEGLEPYIDVIRARAD
ncbi:MAG: hypothetical protein CSA66_03470, partial [Proteobacteria bacterium]